MTDVRITLSFQVPDDDEDDTAGFATSPPARAQDVAAAAKAAAAGFGLADVTAKVETRRFLATS